MVERRESTCTCLLSAVHKSFHSSSQKSRIWRQKSKLWKISYPIVAAQIVTLQQKKQELSSFLRERAKGALVRSCFTSVRGMDAPPSYFFNLEKSASHNKEMVGLQLPDGMVTTDQTQMRQHAVEFYSDLFRKEDCGPRV